MGIARQPSQMSLILRDSQKCRRKLLQFYLWAKTPNSKNFQLITI